MTPPDLPTPPGAFDAPWQLRGYALFAALREQGVVDETEFADRVAAPSPSPDATEGASVPARWVQALEQLLVESGQLSARELANAVERQRVAAGVDDHGRSTHVARHEPVHVDPGAGAQAYDPT